MANTTAPGDDWFRHEAECRYWLAVTGGDLLKVNDAMDRIAQKRGKAAADRVRGGMRAEWVKQNRERQK